MSSTESGSNVVPKPTWDQGSGVHIRHKLSSSAIVIKLAVSPEYIVLSLDDQTIHVFKTNGDPVTVFRDSPQDTSSLAVEGNVLLTGEIGGRIRCFDLDKRELTRNLLGHTDTVRCVRFAGANIAVSASRDALLKIWDIDTGACQATMAGHADAIVDLAITNEHAISGSLDGTAKVWFLPQQRLISTLSGHTGAIYRVDTDGKRVFTGSLDQNVRIWDCSTGQSLATLRAQALVSQIAVQGEVLVTGGTDGRIMIWSLHDYTALRAIPNAHEGAVSSLDVCNGHMLSGGSDGTVKLWDLKTGEMLGDLETNLQAVWGVSLGAAMSKMVVVASAQGTSPFPKHDDAFLDIWSLS